MQRQNSRSEVAHLRAQIAREHQAASWARAGLADGTAKHRFITRRYNQIGGYQEQLAQLIGEQASIHLVIEILETSPAQQQEGAHE